MRHHAVGLLVTLTLGLLMVPCTVESQPSAHVPRIGLLSILSSAVGESKAESFRQGLRDVGYMEGKNILIESRWAEGHRERLAELAADLVRLDVAVIVTESPPAALAAQQATHTIPIVTAAIGDPVALGLVASLARRQRHRVNVSSPPAQRQTARIPQRGCPTGPSSGRHLEWDEPRPCELFGGNRGCRSRTGSPVTRRRGAQPGGSRQGV